MASPFSQSTITLFIVFLSSLHKSKETLFLFVSKEKLWQQLTWLVLPRDIASPKTTMVGLLPWTLAIPGTTTSITTNMALFLEHWVTALSTAGVSGAPLFFHQDLADFTTPDSKITNPTFLKPVFFARSRSGIIVTSSCTGKCPDSIFLHHRLVIHTNMSIYACIAFLDSYTLLDKLDSFRLQFWLWFLNLNLSFAISSFLINYFMVLVLNRLFYCLLIDMQLGVVNLS